MVKITGVMVYLLPSPEGVVDTVACKSLKALTCAKL